MSVGILIRSCINCRLTGIIIFILLHFVKMSQATTQALTPTVLQKLFRPLY